MDSMTMPITSLIGSALTFAWTCYFWLVRVKRERPDLRPYFADHEMFLGTSTGETRQVGVKLGLVVANYSSLPNAVLGVRLWLRRRDGEWLAVENLSYAPDTPMPFNVPAMQTVVVRLVGRVAFPYADDLEGTPQTLADYLEKHLAGPREFGVEVRGLGNFLATAELTAG
jgi:hypothetical protein